MRTRSTLALLFAFVLAAPAVAIGVSDAETTWPAGHVGISVNPQEAGDAFDVGAETVTIKRDAWGVPHVYADSIYGVFWGNGYAQAQDRLFQIDVLRHVGKGESARIVGPSQLEMDLATRRELYTDEERQARWDALPEDQKAMFQGFADGINTWINHTQLNPHELSAEFYAVGHLPEQWVATDTIAVAEFLLDIFGAGSGGNELENAKVYGQLVAELGEAEARNAFDDFFWLQDETTYTTIDPEEYTYAPTEELPGWENIPDAQWDVIAAAAGATPFAGPMDPVETIQDALGFRFGSNALVVAPEYAQSGNALLLGGPQMAYHNPTIPYEVALHGGGCGRASSDMKGASQPSRGECLDGGYDAVGMGVGGAPGVIIGRNTHLAWTVTSGSSDQVDVVAERLVPGNARQYYNGNDIEDMDCRLEVHYGIPTAVDQSAPVLATQEVCRTLRGPVFAMNEEAGYAFVRERTHRLDELRSGILWLTLAQNTDMGAFAAHMETFCFEFNFHVAADNGNIGYYHFGCNPDRASGYDPRFPRVAGEWDWVDVRSGSELPRIVNPEKGYIVNWNNKPAQGWSSGDSMEKWGPVHRAQLYENTVADFIAADGKLSAADLDAIHEIISVNSPFPTYYRNDLALALSGLPGSPAEAAALMFDWIDSSDQWVAPDATCAAAPANDTCFGTYEPGFIIYEEWRKAAHERAFRDELGPYVRELGFIPEVSSDPHAADHGREDNKENVLYRALHGDTAHDWLDEGETSFLLNSFMEAWSTLSSEFNSTDPADWREPTRTMKFVALSGSPAWRLAMVNRPTFPHWYDLGTGEAGSALPPGTDQYWDPIPFLEFQANGGEDVTPGGPHKRDQLDIYAAFDWKPAQLVPPGAWESEQTFTLGGPLP